MPVRSLTNKDRFERWLFLIAIASVLGISLFPRVTSGNAPPPRIERSDGLPSKLGNFELFEFAREIKPRDRDGSPQNHLLSIIDADYGINGDSNFHVTIFKWENDSAAYADLTRLRKREGRTSAPNAETI